MRGLTGRCGRAPWRAPSPLHKPLKIYPTSSDLRRLRHLRLHLPGPRNSPVYIQSLPEHCLRLKKKKKKSFLLNKGAFKEYTIYRACSLQKNPSGGPHPSIKKKNRRKIKRKKERKIIVIEKDSTNKRCFSYDQAER